MITADKIYTENSRNLAEFDFERYNLSIVFQYKVYANQVKEYALTAIALC